MPKDKGGPAWSFDARARGSGYRGPDGRFISAKQAAGFRDEFIDKQKLRVDGLTDKLVDGKINIQQWELETRKIIKDTYGIEYAAAKGGVKNVTSAEWGALGPKLRDEQYTKLHGFAQDIADGKLSPAQINARTSSMLKARRRYIEQGKAENKGIDTKLCRLTLGTGKRNVAQIVAAIGISRKPRMHGRRRGNSTTPSIATIAWQTRNSIIR